MNFILPLLFVAVFGANNTIPSVGCQKVLDPLRKERDSICFIKSSFYLPYIAFNFNAPVENGDDAFLFTLVLNKYCTDRCLQARTNYTTMFGNDACKNDFFDIGDGINVTGSLFAKMPVLQNSGFCRRVNNQYCAVTEWNDPPTIDRYTTQNKTYLCTDCKKDYFSNPNEFRVIDPFSAEIAANSTKAFNNYEQVCGPINKKSSALGMDFWTANLAVFLMYLGL
ncbi:hypothetical protein HDV02_000686 [Globomyces sp. JEL0801]|nr:hypothetical protein HDV02_000686 [Globomyces sp. JEL0801]